MWNKFIKHYPFWSVHFMKMHPYINEIDGAILKILLIDRMKAACTLFSFLVKVAGNLVHKKNFLWDIYPKSHT